MNKYEKYYYDCKKKAYENKNIDLIIFNRKIKNAWCYKDFYYKKDEIKENEII